MKNYDNSDRAARNHERIRVTDAQHEENYRIAAGEWVRETIANDPKGRWYPFILNNLRVAGGVSDRAVSIRRLAVTRACETATTHITTRARSNPRRQHPDEATKAMYLPAVKVEEDETRLQGRRRVHLHGWFRVPKTDTTTSVLDWKDEQKRKVSIAPSSLVRFSSDLCARLATTNIWWNLNDDPIGSVEYAERKLQREKREWGQLEQQPAYLFQRALEQVA
jgi:hypothetical protein